MDKKIYKQANQFETETNINVLYYVKLEMP